MALSQTFTDLLTELVQLIPVHNAQEHLQMAQVAATLEKGGVTTIQGAFSDTLSDLLSVVAIHNTQEHLEAAKVAATLAAGGGGGGIRCQWDGYDVELWVNGVFKGWLEFEPTGGNVELIAPADIEAARAAHRAAKNK